MAVRTDATGDYLQRSTNLLNYNAPYTWMVWAKRVGAADDYQPVLIIDGGSGSDADYLTFYVPTGKWSCYVSNNTTWVGGDAYGSHSINVWFHCAIVRESVSSCKFYIDGALLTTLSQDETGRPASARMGHGNWSGLEQANACYAASKAWSAALTQEEVQQEMHAIRPVRTANLYGWWPMFPGSGERVRDYSGNGNDWTEGGTLTDEDPPPVSWGAPFWIVPFAAAASGDISGTASGTSTANATLAGTGALAGSAAGAAAPTATLVGTGALAGTGSGAATASGALSGVGALAGTAAGISSPTATLSGAGILAGQADGVSVANATLLGNGSLAGQADGAGAATGTLDQPSGSISGTAAGTTTVSGTLLGDGILAGLAAGVSMANATLLGDGALAGLAAGSASLTGTLNSGGFRDTKMWIGIDKGAEKGMVDR